MKLTRSIITILLLLFVVTTVGTLIAHEVARPNAQTAEVGDSASSANTSPAASSETATSEQESAMANEPERPISNANEEPATEEVPAGIPSDASPAVAEACVTEAVYFHNTYRCVTCVKIENAAKAIVEAEFADELALGTLQWLAINMEEERAYISLYDLAMPSLVLIRRVGDEVVDWTMLHDTWSQIGSSTRFSAYIRAGVGAFLEGCP